MEKSQVEHCMTLRPITVDDFETVLLWSQDEAFCLANDWPTNRSVEQLYNWWLKCVLTMSDGLEGLIRLGILFDNKLIGYVDLASIKDYTAEIGIAIGDSSLWGKGLGYSAIRLLIDYGASNYGLKTFYGETHEQNRRSRKMLEKVGFYEISQIGHEEYLGVSNRLIQYQYDYR